MDTAQHTERGRPRSFDADEALDAALAVFWRDGYQAASVAALAEAMGINKPSLYAAFGDKASLYVKALQRYVARESDSRRKLLEDEPNLRRALEGYLLAGVNALTDPARPRGCFVATGAADCGSPGTPPEVERMLMDCMAQGQALFEARIATAVAEGQLPADTDVSGKAVFLAGFATGLAMQARAGTTRRALRAAVKAALDKWP